MYPADITDAYGRTGWTVSSNITRFANNDPNSMVQFVESVPGHSVHADLVVTWWSYWIELNIGIGLDTSAISTGPRPLFSPQNVVSSTTFLNREVDPGYHYLSWLEKVTATGTAWVYATRSLSDSNTYSHDGTRASGLEAQIFN